MTDREARLTALAHGGGCGCKLSPAMLRELLAGVPAMRAFPNLLVGTETGDDAAVYRISADQAVIATTDFFMPIVDDPFDFGRIAASNALSDVYAMGGRPILALAILGMPLGKVDPAAVSRILAGGAAVCEQAGIPVAGGHSIDAPEPIYGLAVVGLVHPDRVVTNAGARAGDVLLLSKPLGVGILGAALKADRIDGATRETIYAALIETTTRLNAVGADLAGADGVHAMTDVTGFGLLGHLLEVCRGSGLAAELHVDAVPLIEGVADLARIWRTGASARNWASYGGSVTEPAGLADWRRDLLTDPQTSGGLLLSVAADRADAVLATLRSAGHAQAAVIGTIKDGAPHVTIV
jgi:selenide,water dikinase